MDGNETPEKPKGYTLIEPAALAPVAGSTECREIAVCILSWLADKLNGQAGQGKEEPAFEVIAAEYQGRYPCLAHGAGGSDFTAQEEASILALLRDHSILDLLQFAGERPYWRQLTRAIMENDRVGKAGILRCVP